MSIALALALAAAAKEGTGSMTERGRAFAEALLATTSTEPPPFTSPRIEYFNWRGTAPVGDRLDVPDTADGLRRSLAGCTIDQVLFEDDSGPDNKDAVYVSFVCPKTGQPTNDIPYMMLRVKGRIFVQVDLHRGQHTPVTTLRGQ